MITFGNPETFALAVAPLAGPPPEGDASGELTWTAMRMVVGGRNLFRHVDSERGIVAEEVCWPAVFLARWLTSSWNAIFHTGAWHVPATFRTSLGVAERMDADLAAKPDAPDSVLAERDEFVARHALRAAAVGAALPDCWFSRDGDVVSVAWSDSIDGQLSFQISRGERDVPATDFAEAVRGFVGWVLGLLEAGAANHEVETDTKALREWLLAFDSKDGARSGLLSEAGLDEARLAKLMKKASARNFEDFFVLPQTWGDRGTQSDVGQSLVAVAFRCVSPVVSEHELLDIRERLLATPPNPGALVHLRQLEARIRSARGLGRDYVQGYRLARELRRHLKNRSDYFDIERYLEDLRMPVIDLPLDHEEIDGGCICDDQHGPTVFVNPRSERCHSGWGRRVVLAHELCHLLFDRSAAVPLAVISGPWAPPRIERCANAFAIDLLLPLPGVEAVIRGRWDRFGDEDVSTLMERYGTGMTATTEHVHNLARPGNRE